MMSQMKKQMVSRVDKIPYIGMDNMSEIFMFCGARDRRTFTFISSETSVIYSKKSEKASLNAITSIVAQRMANWILPNVSSKKVTWEECMPPIFTGRKNQITEYVHYQAVQQMKTAGVMDQLSYAQTVQKAENDDLCCRMGSLSTILMLSTSLTEDGLPKSPYEVLDCVSGEFSPGVVDSKIEEGVSTLVDIGMGITCGDGTFLPIAYVMDW